MGGLFVQMVVLASLMVKPLAGWCVISRSPHGRIDVMFGPVVTTEAHLAFSGARIHSSTCMVIVGIWVTNALIMLLLLGSSLATMSPRAGFDTTLTPLNVSMGATVSVKLLNDFSTFEQTLRHHTRKGFSIGSFHRVHCVLCGPHVCSCHVTHLLSAFCFLLSLDHCFPNK